MLPTRKNDISNTPMLLKSSATTTVFIVLSACCFFFFTTTSLGGSISGGVTTAAYASSLKTSSSDASHKNNNHQKTNNKYHHHHPFSTTNKAPNNDENCVTNPWPSYYSNVLKMGEKLEANTAMLTTTSFAYLNSSTGVFAVYAILPKHRDVWTTAISTGQTATVENMKNTAVSNNQVVYNFGCKLGFGSETRAAYVTLVPKAGVQVFDTNGHLYCSPTTVYPAAIGVPSTSQLVLEDNCGISLFTEAPLTNAVWGSNTWLCGEVHIVPHSHDDVGWLLTPERYYDGCYDPNGGVQSIIRTMVEALYENPIRRFIQVEQYFFHRWWLRQSDQLKMKARTVIERGQLVFINGAWSMHDEAGVHQESAISNWARGIQFVDEEFGPAGGNVTVGWHIDPFGHASATPRMMAQLGFNSFFFWRTDYQQANHMKSTKTLETVWSSSPSLGEEVLMFTSIMPDGYCKGCGDSFDACPSPFCCFTCMDADGPPWWKQVFDTQLRADQKKSSLPDMRKMFRMPPLSKEKDHDHKIHDIRAFTDEFILELAQYGSMYRTNKVLVPWGCDFQHIDAFSSFGLMDAVFEDVVARYPYLTFEYSTPDMYLQRVLNSGFKWPMNFDDYFLDSDNEHAYWSGYLTSHAEYKHFERNLMNRRSSTDILLSSQIPDPESFSSRWNDVDALRQALGVAQHHDSITGTARASVWNQYRKILTLGMRQSDSTLALLLQDITGLEHPRFCDLGNVSVCVYTSPLSPNGTVTVIVYNSLQHDRQEVVTVPIPTNQEHISIVAAATYDGATGAKAFKNPSSIPMQVQSTWELTTTTDPTSTPYPAAPHPYEALIRVSIPARGVFAFTLLNTPSSSSTTKKGDSTSTNVNAEETLLPLGAPAVSFGNRHVTVTVDPDVGLIHINTTSATGVKASTAVRQGFYWYCPNAGEGGTQASGAYIFRPCTPDAKPIPFAHTLHKMVIVKGPVCTEARMIVDYESNIQQAIRICNDDTTTTTLSATGGGSSSSAFDPFSWENYVTLAVGMGSVDAGTLGKEIVMKITIHNDTIKSQSTWYVDSQGLELQKRVRDSRPNYPYNATEPVAANFFPTNQWAMINDSSLALAVVSDYSRATASLQDGELEFLMIRRLLHDDGRGVGQALNNSERVISRNRIYFGDTSGVIEAARFASATHTHPSLLAYSQQRVDTNITTISKAFARFQHTTATKQQQKPKHHYMTTPVNSFSPLPQAIHLHTLEMIDPTTVILRLQHMFAVGESSTYSIPFSVDIAKIIPTTIGSITNIMQTDLSGVKSLEALNQQRQSRRYDICNADTGKHFTGPKLFHTAIDNPSTHTTIVTLRPMDIITFRVTISHNNNNPLLL